jgi:D-xylose transport system permease protein
MTFRDTFAALVRRLPRGELGAAPVLAGLVLIAVVFQAQNPFFLTPRNLTNLVLQIAAMGTLSVGIVLVLLLGEIDLSVGAVSGLAAAVTAVLSVKFELPGALAIAAGVGVGALVGLFQGLWITRLRVPSFVVTLAGLLAWQGVLLYLLRDTGTVNLTDPALTALTGVFLGPAAGWAVGALCVLAVGVALSRARLARLRAGLPAPSARAHWGRLGLLASAVLGPVAVLSADRGVPVALLTMLGVVAAVAHLTRRTRWGRHLFAVGGNAEAARRAGIAVDRVRVAVFVLASALAAFSGILASSRLLAVNQSSGTGDVLLNAIAAAVIGGTSLFGGRGTAWSALLGALVIGSISNGMDLLALASSVKFMITGAVLLVAVSLDAVARQPRS